MAQAGQGPVVRAEAGGGGVGRRAQGAAGGAKILSQGLGDAHDLAMLAAALASDSGITTGVAADGDALRKLIEHRREELLGDARSLGRRVYAETPKAYQRRVRRYLKSAVAESASREPAAMTV